MVIRYLCSLSAVLSKCNSIWGGTQNRCHLDGSVNRLLHKKAPFLRKKKPKTDAYHVLFLFISPFFFHSFLSFSLFFFSSFSFFPLIFFSSSPPSNRLLYPRSGQVENSVRVCVWVPHQHVGYPFHGCCRATAASDHYVSPWRRVSVCFEASTQYGTFAASVFHEASRWPPLALGTIERLHDPPLL